MVYSNPYRPNYQPIFIGREAEMGLLRAALDDACAGHGGVALLVGEPGIGKTRTAEELGLQAAQRSAQVLWGRCYEGGSAPAFWPWVQIIRTYVRVRGPDILLAEMQTGAVDLARLVPEIRDRLPHLPPAPLLDDEQARFRLFDSMTTFLVRAAQTQPLVLILDDLHWADTPSLLLLQFLASELRHSPILVIGAYRDVEVDRDHPLAKTVAELGRLRVGLPVLLGGLGAHDVTHFIELTTGQTPAAALLAAIITETAGNPFFIIELTHLLARTGSVEHSGGDAAWTHAIPPTVRGAIRQRLNRLSAACNHILNSAAVMGRDFSPTRLLRLGDLSQDALLTGLDEALKAHLITPIPERAGRYRFIHDLVRETLYEELPMADRVRLHQRVGVMLEELYAADLEAHLAELSHHFSQAPLVDGLDKAIDYTMRAAERNMRLLAYEEAGRHYERALHLLSLREYEASAQHCDLLLALGQAQTRSGETTQAREIFERAAKLAQRMHSTPYLCRAALGFAGGVVTPGVADERVIALLAKALAALGDADYALRARLLGRLAMEYRYSPSQERREEFSREAVEIARRLDDRSTLVFALTARHYAILGPNTLEQRMAISIELAQLATETGDGELALQSLPWRLADLLDLGHVRAVDEAIETSARLAEELRQPLYLWYIGVFRALRALMNGQFAEGERLANTAHALGQRVQSGAADVYFAAQMFVLYRDQGRLQEVEKPLLDILAQYPAMPVIRCMLALVYRQSGRIAEAQAELTRLCANNVSALPWDQLWLGAVTILAEVATLLADRVCAAVLYELLLPYERRNVVVGVPICLGSAATYLGCLATILERWPAATQHFEDALAINTRLGAKPFLAWTQYYYGVMLLQRNQGADREQASKLLEQAQAAVQELEMSYLADQIRRLQAETPPRQSAPAYPDGLTPREVEVLRLIAAGKSTKEIAATLVISSPTVERHITHIYEKIGARGRAEATTYALRHSLV
jgi:DNA-binding CsgD family transcriptional regulator